MNDALPLPPFSSELSTTQPLIDWDYWLKRRPYFLEICQDLPEYLILPEVNLLLSHIHDNQTRFLVDTLWHTGARISEALSLTKDSFFLNSERDSLVVLETLKQKARGRPKKNGKEKEKPKRSVPIYDTRYITETQRFIVSGGFKKGDPLFPISRQTVDNRLKKIQRDLEAHDITFPLKISAHTFRHSFAVNALLQRRDPKIIQKWLGHESEKSTAIYLQILSVETHHHMYGMEF